MGFIDFSSVPGGEEYADSIDLGLLDALESLRWIQNNIEAFGGNPSTDNTPWTEYDTADRNTVVMNDDGTMTLVSDPLSEERVLSGCLGYVDISGGNGK